MKEEDDAFKKFRDSLNGKNVHFHILEHRVPVELQMEYFKYAEKFHDENYKELPAFINVDTGDELYYSSLSEILVEPETETEIKKLILSRFAASKDVKAYRLLEEYARHPDDDVRDWAYMALMESRISLETRLSDEKQVYISTGLGGKGDKLRYYVLMLSKDGKPFLEYQRNEIDHEFAYALPQADCEIERLTIDDRYVELVFLAPVRADVKEIIGGVINECNQYGNPLSDTFTITNVKELSPQEIAEIINKDEDSKASH